LRRFLALRGAAFFPLSDAFAPASSFAAAAVSGDPARAGATHATAAAAKQTNATVETHRRRVIARDYAILRVRTVPSRAPARRSGRQGHSHVVLPFTRTPTLHAATPAHIEQLLMVLMKALAHAPQVWPSTQTPAELQLCVLIGDG
jgi:hypothetical protein